MRKSSISKPSTANGMTLIELLMTLSIVAVIVALIASGNFRDLIDDTWLWFSTSNVQGNFQLAKTEAVTRNLRVVLCAKTEGVESCSGQGDNGWRKGFIMFTDPDEDNTYDGDPEILLRVGDTMPRQVFEAPSHYIFSPDGTIKE